MLTGEHLAVDSRPAHALRSVLERDISESALSQEMEGVSAEAVNIVSGLLHPEPGFRIGTTMGIGEVLHHPWFSDMDMNAL